jgi:NADPH:quinone reductase-like Zn-dependent oxidoreductase
MRAIVYHNYGSPAVLKCEEVEQPTAGVNEVLIKVHAASVNALDSHLRSADIVLVRLTGGGLLRPKDPRLGSDLAGRVEAVGSRVTQFRTGDDVFGIGLGAFAEYACAREDAVVLKPDTVTFEAAATLPIAALTALQGLRDKGQIRVGQRVLIQGASGGVGTFAVQIAKSFGAQVTAVCSTRNVEMARSIGADHVIDYTQEDFTRNGQRYDLILAINGYHPILAYRRALGPAGIYVLVGASSSHLLRAMRQAIFLGPLLSRSAGRKMCFMGMARVNQKDLSFVRELVEAGKVVPVIDARYPLSEAAEAFRYFEETHAKGKVVLTMEHNRIGA